MRKMMSNKEKAALLCLGVAIGSLSFAFLLLGVSLGCKMSMIQYAVFTELSEILVASDNCTEDVFTNFTQLLGLGLW